MRTHTNLDFIRAVAVMLVIFSHVWFYTGSRFAAPSLVWFLGGMGVFTFFTHTTLVLMWSLERDPHTVRFYLRRAFRLYPLWLVVLFTSVAVRLPTSPAYAPRFAFYHPSWSDLVSNALLIFNLNATGDKLIGASWSLPVEAQMYILLPFLFFFIRSNRTLFPLLLLDLLAMATSRELFNATTSNLVSCAPLFLAGAIAYVGYKKWRPRFSSIAFVGWFALLVTSVNLFASHWRNSFRSGWIFTLLLGLSLPLFRPITWKPLVEAAQWIARYSYGFYLSHFAAIAVAFHYLTGRSLLLRAVSFFAVLIGCSVVLYHTVEKPMIAFGLKMAARVGRGPEVPLNRRELSLETAP